MEVQQNIYVSVNCSFLIYWQILTFWTVLDKSYRPTCIRSLSVLFGIIAKIKLYIFFELFVLAIVTSVPMSKT